MMQETVRPWLNHYPQGVPANIGELPYSTLADLLETSFSRHGQRTAQTFMGNHFSYDEINKKSLWIASYLQSIGLVKGDRVAVMLPNIPQYTVIAAAVLRAGLVLVNVNPLYTSSELQLQLSDAQPRVAFIIDYFAATLASVVDTTPLQHVIVTHIGDMLNPVKNWLIQTHLKRQGRISPYQLTQGITFKRVLHHGKKALGAYQKPFISTDDIALLQYTGGTTGLSKGAVLLHRNLVANVIQLYLWIASALDNLSQNKQINFIGALPLYHIFAFAINLLMAFHLGGNNILITNPKDLDAMMKDLKKQPFHIFPAVNTLFNAIANHPQAKEIDWHSLRLSVGGGMPVQQATAQKWYDLTGCPLIEGYGMSETSPVISAHRVDKSNKQPLCQGIGYPMPSTEIMLLDDAGHPVPEGKAGELLIKGPQVMASYWNNPQETEKVLTPEGFLRTGDIAVMQADGWLRIVDRKKDMILVSGFSVYPNEIEDTVALIEGVQECVAMGIPDKRSGETVALMVVKKDQLLTSQQIKQWCKTHLTGYKRPRIIEFCEMLPKSSVGKILRKEAKAYLLKRINMPNTSSSA